MSLCRHMACLGGFYHRIGSSIVGTRNLRRRLVLVFGQIATFCYDVFYERGWTDDVAMMLEGASTMMFRRLSIQGPPSRIDGAVIANSPNVNI